MTKFMVYGFYVERFDNELTFANCWYPTVIYDSSDNIKQLKVSLDKLFNYADRIENLDKQIFLLLENADQDELTKEIESSIQYNEWIQEAVSSANVFLAEVKTNDFCKPNSDTLSESDIPKKDDSSKNRLRLPKIEISSFKGDPLEWQGFWDSFNNAIHENSNLSEIDKFNYLKGFLSDEAARVVDGYRLTAANYQVVIDVLTERFGNKQKAVFAHIEAMLAIPESTHDIDKLQMTSDSCEKHVRSLVALGLTEDTFGQVFAPIMLSKLPRYVKTELQRRNGSQEWKLDNIRTWLKDEIRARELGDKIFGSHENDASFKQKFTNSRQNATTAKRKIGTAFAFVSNANKPTKICSFCGKDHFTDQCDKVSDASSRRKICQEQRLCYNCLGKGHSIKQCKKKGVCVYCHKTGHHRSLCVSKFGPLNASDSSASVGTSTDLSTKAKTIVPITQANQCVASTDTNTTAHCTVLQTALAHIGNVNSYSQGVARLLFDTAGSRSFITETKQRELNLPVLRKEWISVSAFQSKKRRTVKYSIVEFNVHCNDGSKTLVSASVVPQITCPIQKLPLDLSGFPNLKQLPLAEPLVSNPEFVPIDVLIGNDFYYDFILSNRIQCPSGPLLLESKLGYIATGRVPANFTGPETIAVMLLHSNQSGVSIDNGNVDFSRYWELEDIGLKDGSHCPSSDESALMAFNSTVKFDQDRYQVQWPWRNPEPEISDNFSLAFGRLKSLQRRIQGDDKMRSAYQDTIQDQVKRGIIEEAPVVPNSNLVYYMPHHPVVKLQSSTTKVRIVYDASSKVSRFIPRLNDCLHRGPVFLEDICGILIRLRLSAVAVMSDIEKAFLGIGLQTSQRDVTRFLWLRDCTKPPENDNLLIYRFCRVPFGIVSSPFLLGATISYHLSKLDSPTSRKILQNLYVDNVIAGVSDANEAISFYHQAKAIFNSASLNLREWYTNDPKVKETFAESDKGVDSSPKVLGIRWNIEKDTLSCPVRFLNSAESVTKRFILKSIASLFDPCGLFSPVTIVGKILIQDIWKQNIVWDDEVPENLRIRWHKFALELEAISVSDIPRYVGNSVSNKAQLHIFCDASTRAYSAVAYLRFVGSSSQCSLIFAKTRLAPLKPKLTVPRLELIAVCIGVRILKYLLAQIDSSVEVTEKYIWTDSKCVLWWIRREHVPTPFVENRLKTIRDQKDIQFRYVDTNSNPADLPTRGVSTRTLMNETLWWKGPDWLTAEPKVWPETVLSVSQDYSDLKTSEISSIESDTDCETLFDASKFSCLTKLLRITAWIMRFVGNLRKTVAEREKGCLLATELNTATFHWIKFTQKTNFPDMQNTSRNKDKRIVHQLQIFSDNKGLLRCGGRIQNASIPYAARHPILLPKNNHFTNLIIIDVHVRLCHAGVGQTLAYMRQKYWITSGRSTVRKILFSCRKCRKVTYGPYQVPPFPPLPVSRISNVCPFEHTGVDHFSPLWIRETSNDSTVKVWGCIFVCMVVRAIHVEVVDSLSTEDFLLAFRRFCALYSVPKLMVSDNSRTFHLADKTIQLLWKQMLQSSEVQDFSTNNGIAWQFVVDYAPWMGSFYERLIGIVKQSLKRSLSKVYLTRTELVTVMMEITSSVNSRPLTYVEDDIGFQALRPIDFLTCCKRDCLPDVHETDDFQQSSTNAVSLIGKEKWKRIQNLAKGFWNTWHKNYLVSLRERHEQHKQHNPTKVTPTIGSVVQIKDNLPRSQWKLGRIEKVHESSDGKIRSVSIKLASGKLICRPIKLIYPLEMAIDNLNSSTRSDSMIPSLVMFG